MDHFHPLCHAIVFQCVRHTIASPAPLSSLLLLLLPCFSSSSIPSPRHSPPLPLILLLISIREVSRWGSAVSFDGDITISALDLSLGEILIFTAVVDHFQKIREEQEEKREEKLDWEEHAADRRRVNVSLNTIDARGKLALRTLREQSLYEVFPSKHVADRLIEAAEDIEAVDQAGSATGSVLVIQKGKLFADAKGTHKRLVDQLTNYVSSINGSGFIDKDCGAPAIECKYVFALTFEKAKEKTGAGNEKFRVLLIREDLLKVVHLRTAEDIADPEMHVLAQGYFKKRWGELQGMADHYFGRDLCARAAEAKSPGGGRRGGRERKLMRTISTTTTKAVPRKMAKKALLWARKRTPPTSPAVGPPAGGGSDGAVVHVKGKTQKEHLLLMSSRSKPLLLVAKGERRAEYSVAWSSWRETGGDDVPVLAE